MRIRLENIFTTLVDEEVPVAFRGYDGTVTGPAPPVATVEVHSPAALGYIVTAPGGLGPVDRYRRDPACLPNKPRSSESEMPGRETETAKGASGGRERGSAPDLPALQRRTGERL